MQAQYYNERQNGSAVIVALFIVALVAILATAMSTRFHQVLLFNETILEKDKTSLLAQGVTFWAIGKLKENVKSANEIHDKIPQIFSVVQNDGAIISGDLEDSQKKFNLNNLRDPRYHEYFTRLLQITNNNLSQQQTQKIFQNILQYIFKVKSANNFINYMWNEAELLNIEGITPEIYENLKPYITVMPDITPININSASKIILQCLSKDINQNDVDKLINYRQKQNGFSDAADFMSEINSFNANIVVDSSILTISSQYFVLETQVKMNGGAYQQRDLLKRSIVNHGNIVTTDIEVVKEDD